MDGARIINGIVVVRQGTSGTDHGSRSGSVISNVQQNQQSVYFQAKPRKPCISARRLDIPKPRVVDHGYLGGLNKKGQRHGYGVQKFPNGSHFKGYWVDGKRNGLGTLSRLNARPFFEGNWINDKRNGLGTLFHLNGRPSFEGNWIDNKRNGLGTLFHLNGRPFFEGNWINDKRNGDGKYSHLGHTYIGYWVDDNIHYANHYLPNGCLVYRGYYYQGKREGDGTSFYPDGKTAYTGIWKGNRPHGQGVAYDKNRQVIHHGQWIAGRPQSTVTQTDDNQSFSDTSDEEPGE